MSGWRPRGEAGWGGWRLHAGMWRLLMVTVDPSPPGCDHATGCEATCPLSPLPKYFVTVLKLRNFVIQTLLLQSFEPFNLFTRTPTATSIGATMIHIMEIKNTGESEEKHLKNHDFLHSLSEKRLPFRDLRMILKCSDKGGLTR